MAITAEELRILVRAETKGAVAELNKFKRTSKKTTLDLKQLAKQLIGPLSVTAGLLALGRVAARSISGSIRYAASVEQISVAFEVLLGSAQAAQVVLEELREFSVKTPFTFEELAPTAQQLISVGVAAKDVVATMRDLGNVAGGNGEKLKRLGDAFSKLKTKGRASLEEINRFSEAGVPLIAQLAENLDMTNEELFKFISAGKVGFDEVNQALQDLARGEGAFAGMLDAQSLTLEGAMSTLKGAVQELGKAFADDFLPFLTESVQQVTALVNQLSAARSFKDVFSEVFGEGFTAFPAGEVGEQIAIIEQRIASATRAQEELIRLADKTNRIGFRTGGLAESAFTKRRGAGALRDAAQEAEQAITILRTQLFTLTGAIETEAESMVGVVVAELGGGGEEAAEGFGKTFFSELVGLAGDEQFFFKLEEEAAEAGAEAGRTFFAELVGEAGNEDFFFTLTDSIEKATFEMELFGSAAQLVSEEINAMPTPFPWVSDASHALDLVDRMAGKFHNLGKVVKTTDEKIDDAFDSLAGDATTAALNIVSGTLSDIGFALTQGADSADQMASAFGNLAQKLLDVLPQLLLNAGLAVMQIPDPSGTALAIGLALVAASGLASFLSGIAKGGMENAGSAGETDLPDPSVIARTGSTFAGDTITIINGDAFVADARDERTVATVNTASANR